MDNDSTIAKEACRNFRHALLRVKADATFFTLHTLHLVYFPVVAYFPYFCLDIWGNYVYIRTVYRCHDPAGFAFSVELGR